MAPHFPHFDANHVGESLEQYASYLASDDPAVREKAAKSFKWILKSYGPLAPQAMMDIYDTAMLSQYPEVRRYFAGYLGNLAVVVGKKYAEKFIAHFETAIGSPESDLRVAASTSFSGIARALGVEYAGQDYSVEILQLYELALSKADATRGPDLLGYNIARSLGDVAHALGIRNLLQIRHFYSEGLKSENSWVRLGTSDSLGEIARAWGEAKTQDIITMSLEALASNYPGVQLHAVLELESISQVLGPSHAGKMEKLCKFVLAHCESRATVGLRNELPAIATVLIPDNTTRRTEFILRIEEK